MYSSLLHEGTLVAFSSENLHLYQYYQIKTNLLVSPDQPEGKMTLNCMLDLESHMLVWFYFPQGEMTGNAIRINDD